MDNLQGALTLALEYYNKSKREIYRVVHPLTNPIEELSYRMDLFDLLLVYTIFFLAFVWASRKLENFQFRHFCSSEDH